MSEAYFSILREGLNRAYAAASEARKKGFDPSDEVEVKIAKDVAARVEGIVGPPGVALIIRDLIDRGMSREDAAFEIARKIAGGEIIKADKERLIEQAVRTGVGILTEGVLVAPTEGISKVSIKKNPDGSDYVAVYYSGPIRSAGGTAAALSLVLADIARGVAGVGDYRATDTQIERYVEEVNTYEARVTHLQYKPPDEDIRHIVKNCPVSVDGEPTEDIEVSAYRGVPGVETNRIRGGVPLVICEGVAQKAAKLSKYTRKLNLGWSWLEKVIKIKRKADKIEIKPDDTYLDGLVAGRPVFSHPSAKGGFRLRYGRSKTNSLMGKNIHPATMVLLDEFIAYGTHIKIERPGKGAVIAGFDGIEPPAVLLDDGSLVKVISIGQAKELLPRIKKIMFLGDLMITYGDFLKSNHPLIPSGWCTEWWEKELQEKGIKPPENIDSELAFAFSRNHSVPLHPDFTFHWHDISGAQLVELANWVKDARLAWRGDRISEMVLPMGKTKEVLEELLVEHRVVEGNIILKGEDAHALLSSLNALKEKKIDASEASCSDPQKPALMLVNELSGILIKPKAPTYIGARMGRPEKAKERAMDGKPNVLFPTGSQKNRSLTKAYRTLKAKEGNKTVNLELVRYKCTQCRNVSFSRACERCGSRAEPERICHVCGRAVQSDIHCDRPTKMYDRRPVDLVDLMESSKARLGGSPAEVKGVKGLSNPMRVPERIEKGFIRAKHGVFVFRDGTSRFDATDIPLTAFTPKEIGLPMEKLAELGYDEDISGNPAKSSEQTFYLKHQDIVLSDSGVEYFMKVTAFLDEMLVNLYGMRPFYGIKSREDLIGHLCAGLSPHTSAGVLCRIIGFTKANVGYGHPYFHTAKRRNCFQGDEKLLVFDGKVYDLIKIRDLVEMKLHGETEKDAFGTEYKKISGLQTFAWNKKTKSFELADITHVSKHESPEKLIQLKTKSGRKITVTPDHSFPDKNGKKVKAEDIGELLVPYRIRCPVEKSRDKISLLSITDNPDVMIRTENDVFSDGASLAQISGDLGLNYKTFTNYIYRKSYPLGIVEKFNTKIIDGGNFTLGSKRDRVSVKPEVILDEDFFSLLGFYLAEGYMKKIQKDTHQVSITATKKWAKKYLSEKVNTVFGVRPCLTGDVVTICSSYVHELFKKLKIGGSAKTKRIPGFVYSQSHENIASFLRGYFSGDGSCSLSSTLEVNVTSVNKWMIDGVSYLLMFLGIRHSIHEEKRKIRSRLITDFYGGPKDLHSYKIRIYGEEAEKFITKIGFIEDKHQNAEILLNKWKTKKGISKAKVEGDAFIDRVVGRKIINSSEKHVYNLTVDEHHTLICSGVTAFQCDGDEDSIMLLLDALLNFSRHYLNETRGGTMDAPLVLTPAIDPMEVDDEAHTIEIVSSYPLEFYRAAERITPPGDVKIKTVKNVLGTPEQYAGLPLTHLGGTLDEGPIKTKYVLLDSIPEKITTQFDLQLRLRPVDAQNAAERLILSHFIPDLYGNLRSFSRQTFRCSSCNEIHRRPPLTGKCLRCGGNLLLTINKGGIKKYLEISRRICDDYDLPVYLKQRLVLVEREINSIFEDDKVKQTGLADFL